MKPKRSNRNREIGIIHMLADQQGLDTKDPDPNSDYRTMLWTVARVRSSSKLNDNGRLLVLKHLGYEPHKKDNPKVWMIKKLLRDSGRPFSYADGIAKQMFGIERFQLCGQDQLSKIIAALNVDARRKETTEG